MVRTTGRCAGVLLEDGRAIRARATIITAGGAAALWSRTTNPPGSTGAGMVLAHRAGAELADLEFLQFHPTAVTGIPGREGFLVTEAIRGEGATLHGPDGERFVEELAPRDEVALAIFRKLRETGAPSVGLDMRHVDPALFPNVVGALRESGLDPARELVPVAPAAHYMMGGIVTDLDGRSTVPGLLRGRRVGVHRPARREPPGVELAERVLRVRRPRGARRRSTSPPPTARRRRPRRGPSPAPSQRDARRDVAARRARAHARGPRASSPTTRTRSPASSPPARCTARRAAARTGAPTSPTSTPISTTATRSSAAAARSRSTPGAERARLP